MAPHLYRLRPWRPPDEIEGNEQNKDNPIAQRQEGKRLGMAQAELRHPETCRPKDQEDGRRGH